MTAKIQLIGVKKRFGPKVVLDGVDLTIDKQSSLVIIGGSGTGKSVTIKSILGIIRPDEGTVLVDGEDVTHIGGSARDKLLRKGADAIVLNDVSKPGIGFDSDRNAATFLTTKTSIELPEMTKQDLASRILDEVIALRRPVSVLAETGLVSSNSKLQE